MSRILVTGGTVFVSKYIAQYFVKKGNEVYVLNRNHRPQVEGVKLIEADRHELKETLKAFDFDAIIDVTAYSGKDVMDLLTGLGNFKEYVMISSSAVYPETNVQPFLEDQQLGENRFWGKPNHFFAPRKKRKPERPKKIFPQRKKYLTGLFFL